MNSRRRSLVLSVALGLFLLVLISATAAAKTLTATPNASPGDSGFYLSLLSQLEPGDTLVLPAGTYRDRLNINNLQGTADAWITITGPESGTPAIVTTESNCCNTVQMGNTWYVAIKHLTIDSNSVALDTSIDGINAKDGFTHDILIEDCTLRGLSLEQQTVGISTKSTAWNWTIRGNTIHQPGTGMYLGYPTGGAPFIAGVIENNLIIDPIGYNIEIKYQNNYSQPAGAPDGPNRTIIRNNVFLHRLGQGAFPGRTSGARPNLLVGGFPNSGYGSTDLYEIYGNFFYANPDESLFQGSGRMSIHDNIFVADGGDAINLQNHDLAVKLAYVYNNTIYGVGRGIHFASSAQEDDAVVGNLVFAATPVSGAFTPENRVGNLTDSVSNAGSHVNMPNLTLGEMDFYPILGAAQDVPLDLSPFDDNGDFEFDFNGDPKGDFRFRGAYAGDGTNPGWQLDEAMKQGGPSSGPGDPPAPLPPTNLRAN